MPDERLKGSSFQQTDEIPNGERGDMNPTPDEIYISNLISKEWFDKDIKSYLTYGRLPCHEVIKSMILRIGIEHGYRVAPEYRVRYFLNRERGGRIDAVWLKDNKVFATFEVEEGINTRGISKLTQTPATFKFNVLFDVRRKMQERVDAFDFAKRNIFPVQLW